MPFKSQAQRRKFARMMVDGEISPDTFEEWSRETGSAKLPERVSPKPPKKKAGAKTAKRAGKKAGSRKPQVARPAKRAKKKSASARR